MNAVKIKKQRALNQKKLLSSTSPAPVKDAYAALRTTLLRTGPKETCPVFIITSALPQEGKSLTAVNLAIAFAQLDKKTLLVDMDLRQPSLHQLFELSRNNGVSEYLSGFENTIDYKESGVENLTVLTSGQKTPKPAELLSGSRAALLMNTIREKYDIVVIDMPPIEQTADAAILSDLVTGYVLVVKKDCTTRTPLKQSLQVLQQVQARVIGFVLNSVNTKERRKYTLQEQL